MSIVNPPSESGSISESRPITIRAPARAEMSMSSASRSRVPGATFLQRGDHQVFCTRRLHLPHAPAPLTFPLIRAPPAAARNRSSLPTRSRPPSARRRSGTPHPPVRRQAPRSSRFRPPDATHPEPGRLAHACGRLRHRPHVPCQPDLAEGGHVERYRHVPQAEANASASGRSTAGSDTLIPPATETKTSCPENASPHGARAPRAPGASRAVSIPVASRRGAGR